MSVSWKDVDQQNYGFKFIVTTSVVGFDQSWQSTDVEELQAGGRLGHRHLRLGATFAKKATRSAISDFEMRLFQSLGHQRLSCTGHLGDMGAEDCVLGAAAPAQRHAGGGLGSDDPGVRPAVLIDHEILNRVGGNIRIGVEDVGQKCGGVARDGEPVRSGPKSDPRPPTR